MAKYLGYGSTISVQTVVSPSTYTPIAQVAKIGGFSLKRDEKEVTTHDSPNFYKEFLGAFKDPGTIQVELIWDPTITTHGAQAFGFKGLYDSSNVVSFKITVNGPSPVPTWTFNAFIIEFKTGDLTPDNPVMATATLRITGAPTLA